MNDMLEWCLGEAERLGQEPQQKDKPLKLWIKKKLSKRIIRLGLCTVTATISFLTFAQLCLSSYFDDYNDFQRRVLVNGDDALNREPFSESLLFGEAEANMDPSIVRICREINNKMSGVPPNQHPQYKGIEVVQETVHVCTSQSLFESMLTLYYSAAMVQTVNELGIGGFVDYKHDCHRFSPNHDNDSNSGSKVRRTVQMAIHSNLLRSRWVELFRNRIMKDVDSIDNVTNKCSSLLEQWISAKTSNRAFSVYTPKLGIKNEEANVMMNFMTENLHFAVLSTDSTKPLVFQSNGDGDVGISSTFASDYNGERHTGRKLLANPNSDAPSHDGLDTVVIYLDSHDTRSFPLYFFALHVPRSATNVIILTSPYLHRATDEVRDTNKVYANLIQGYIKELVPRAKVEIVIGDFLGSLDVARMLFYAGTLICPPGSDCWIPAIVRGRGEGIRDDGRTGRLVVNRQRTVMVDSDGEDGIEFSHIFLNLSQLSPKYTSHIHILPLSSTRHLVIRPDKSIHPSVLAFLWSPPTDKAVCPAVRGRHGTWVKDMKFAAKLQYTTPVDHLFGFADQRYRPMKNRPYRASTTYRWIEDRSLKSCPIQLVNIDSFCDTMANLNVGRLFFVGDFVGMNQAYSLWKLLGHSDSPKPITESEPGWSRDVVCPKKKGRGSDDSLTVQIVYTRNDIMQENTKPVDLPKKVSNCSGYLYCYRWTDRYMDYYKKQEGQNSVNRRTILITSFGPHVYEESLFQIRMANFLNALEIDLKDRLAKDIIFYRNIAPGHEFCNQKSKQTPFRNFEEYRSTITELYSWDIHDGFNDIAERMIREFNDSHYNNNGVGQNLLATQEINSLAPVHVLDVYSMSVLRRDGHIGGPDCAGCSIKHDCFHYSLPGPSDWWNHLLFSNLADMALAEKRWYYQQPVDDNAIPDLHPYKSIMKEAFLEDIAEAR